MTTDPQPIQIQVSWRSFTSEDLTVEQLLDIFFVHLCSIKIGYLQLPELKVLPASEDFLTKVQLSISELS